MISAAEFDRIIAELRAHPEPLNGFPLEAHIDWSEKVAPPASAEEFAMEAIFVICNSGMRHTIARKLFERCRAALLDGEPVATDKRAARGQSKIFNHHGKTAAMDDIWSRREDWFSGYLAANDKVEYCGTLPYVGDITKFHLAKNFGADVAKPDVHLERLAGQHGTTPQLLCEQLAALTGYRARTVDLILWMACAKGVLDSRTGQFRRAA